LTTTRCGSGWARGSLFKKTAGYVLQSVFLLATLALVALCFVYLPWWVGVLMISALAGASLGGGWIRRGI
jgi:hypothetical protein